jgi:hypothetical protein
MDDVSRRDVMTAAAGVAGVVALTGVASAQPGKPGAGGQSGSEFILKLNGIKLPAEVEQRIAGELQAALMREIARVDLKSPLTIRIPNREWYGIWLERLGRGGEIPRLQVQVGG